MKFFWLLLFLPTLSLASSIINPTSTGGGIVSPGTFTWTNNYGINVSTIGYTIYSSSPTVSYPGESLLSQVDSAAPCLWTYDASGNRYHLCFTLDNPVTTPSAGCQHGMPLGLLLSITCS